MKPHTIVIDGVEIDAATLPPDVLAHLETAAHASDDSHVGYAGDRAVLRLPAHVPISEAVIRCHDAAATHGTALTRLVCADGTVIPIAAEATIDLPDEDTQPVPTARRKSAIKAVKALTSLGHQQAANVVDGHDHLLPDDPTVHANVAAVLDAYRSGQVTVAALRPLMVALGGTWTSGAGTTFTYTNAHGKWDGDGRDLTMVMLRTADGRNEPVDTGLPDGCPDPLRAAKRLASLTDPDSRWLPPTGIDRDRAITAASTLFPDLADQAATLVDRGPTAGSPHARDITELVRPYATLEPAWAGVTTALAEALLAANGHPGVTVDVADTDPGGRYRIGWSRIVIGGQNLPTPLSPRCHDALAVAEHTLTLVRSGVVQA